LLLSGEEDEVDHFDKIVDKFDSYGDLSDAIRQAGLDSSNLIIGVDFTASNEWQGRDTFDRKSLHFIDPKGRSKGNPYQRVIATLAETLEPFDEDNFIPAFGFGDIRTKDKDVFPFSPDGRPCRGLHDILNQYERIAPDLDLSGPSSLAPIIEKSIEIVKEAETYHILVIIADGQVEKDQDKETRDAIVKASYYPISIILVGVGDGPWDRMYAYDEKLELRKFDNFQFIAFHEVIKGTKNPDLTFALHALMEIPDQYLAIKKLGLLKDQPQTKDAAEPLISTVELITQIQNARKVSSANVEMRTRKKSIL